MKKTRGQKSRATVPKIQYFFSNTTISRRELSQIFLSPLIANPLTILVSPPTLMLNFDFTFASLLTLPLK
jgi:hypothetical protein